MDGLLDRDPELAELDSRIELTLAGQALADELAAQCAAVPDPRASGGDR